MSSIINVSERFEVSLLLDYIYPDQDKTINFEDHLKNENEEEISSTILRDGKDD